MNINVLMLSLTNYTKRKLVILRLISYAHFAILKFYCSNLKLGFKWFEENFKSFPHNWAKSIEKCFCLSPSMKFLILFLLLLFFLFFSSRCYYIAFRKGNESLTDESVTFALNISKLRLARKRYQTTFWNWKENRNSFHR